MFPRLKALYTVWDKITPEALRLAYPELLLSGCTTAGDHHDLFPEGLESTVDIQAEEAGPLGLRAFVTPGLREPVRARWWPTPRMPSARTTIRSSPTSNLMEGVRHALMLNRLTYGAERVTHLRRPALGDGRLGLFGAP